MATSQFTIYTSADLNGPGLMFGTTGSLIKVLDACLVNGYTNKPSAGWTKPLTDLSASAGGPGVLTAYKQASGSQMTMLINDAGPNTSATYREAWACGYESLTSLTGSTGAGVIFTGSYAHGTGVGQFPLPAQLLTTGHVVIRKSATLDATVGRPWRLFADASTMYLFVLTADTAGAWMGYYFGDIFSLAGSTDNWKCIIIGRTGENNSTYAGTYEGSWTWATSGLTGYYMPRTWTGAGNSINVGRHGDVGKSNANAHIDGTCPATNGPDNALYISPLWITETSGHIRGRMRGYFQCCHVSTYFGDGQNFNGAGDYAGKTFEAINFILSAGQSGGKPWCIMETSPTIETN